MSIEDLQADLSANLAEAKNLSALSTIGDVTNHLKNTLWPFLENLTGELVEMDDALDTMYTQQDDVLQFETGKQLMATIAGAKMLIDSFKPSVTDPKVLSAIAEWERGAQESAKLIEEITLPEVPDEDEDKNDDEDEDENDDEDDKDEGEGDDDQEGTKPQ